MHRSPQTEAHSNHHCVRLHDLTKSGLHRHFCINCTAPTAVCTPTGIVCKTQISHQTLAELEQRNLLHGAFGLYTYHAPIHGEHTRLTVRGHSRIQPYVSQRRGNHRQGLRDRSPASGCDDIGAVPRQTY